LSKSILKLVKNFFENQLVCFKLVVLSIPLITIQTATVNNTPLPYTIKTLCETLVQNLLFTKPTHHDARKKDADNKTRHGPTPTEPSIPPRLQIRFGKNGKIEAPHHHTTPTLHTYTKTRLFSERYGYDEE
jgi:hypothetical protein